LGFLDGEEDCWDLEDIVEVFFGAGAVFEEFVFVARQFELFLACCRSVVDLISVRDRRTYL
jgi:hypothetical protein